jgi:glycosyltransferase involved in cell wall biosynthesis
VKVLVLAQQLSGYDGVSITATQQGIALRKHLGHEVTFMSGNFGPGTLGWDRQVRFGATWASEPGGTPPAVDEHLLESEVDRGDLVIVHNLFALPSAPCAAIAIRAALAKFRKPHIVIHHDFAHEAPGRKHDPRFPLLTDSGVHLCINSDGADFLRSSGASPYIEPPAGPLFHMTSTEYEHRRTATRSRLGVARSEILCLLPVTPYPRKNVAAAIALVAEARRQGAPLRLWCTGATTANLTSLGCLEQAVDICLVAGRAEHNLDAFAAADRLIMPSDQEGWGMPITEAAFYGLPVVTSDMPVISDHERMGLLRRPMTVDALIAALTPAEHRANIHYSSWFQTHRVAQRLEEWIDLACSRAEFRPLPAVAA